MFNKIRKDMKRYEDFGGWYSNLGFWVTLSYRFGNYAYNIKFLPFRLLIRIFSVIFILPSRLFFQVELESSAEIGGGLLMIHPFSVIITKGTVLGKDCTIYHDVTFGLGEKEGLPVLQDHVVVFPGARVLGGVHIGTHAKVVANSVVFTDVPDGATAIGIPAKILKLKDKTENKE